MAAKESVKRKTPTSGSKTFKTKKQKSTDNHGSSTNNENKDGISSSALKRQVRKDRQSTRRHADCVAEGKVLWNKLRLKTNTSKDTKDLMDKVMTLIRGKVNEIALQHDASRVVQAAIQFGNEEQRKEILTEVCKSEGSLAEMAKIQYAHFCCLKFIKYCARDDASIKMIVKVSNFSSSDVDILLLLFIINIMDLDMFCSTCIPILLFHLIKSLLREKWPNLQFMELGLVY